MKKNNNDNNLIAITISIMFIVCFVIVCIILFGGYASGESAYSSYVNITIQSQILIRMTRDNLSWGPGTIDLGANNATLYTQGDDPGIVLRGNWSGTDAKAFVIENIGSVNCSLRLQTGKSAHDFFNSYSGTNEEYKWKISNKEADSCSGGADLNVWANVNNTPGGTEYCRQFDPSRQSNEIYVDILLTIPADVQNTGDQSDTITIIADSSG